MKKILYIKKISMVGWSRWPVVMISLGSFLFSDCGCPAGVSQQQNAFVFLIHLHEVDRNRTVARI